MSEVLEFYVTIDYNCHANILVCHVPSPSGINGMNILTVRRFNCKFATSKRMVEVLIFPVIIYMDMNRGQGTNRRDRKTKLSKLCEFVDIF